MERVVLLQRLAGTLSGGAVRASGLHGPPAPTPAACEDLAGRHCHRHEHRDVESARPLLPADCPGAPGAAIIPARSAGPQPTFVVPIDAVGAFLAGEGDAISHKAPDEASGARTSYGPRCDVHRIDDTDAEYGGEVATFTNGWCGLGGCSSSRHGGDRCDGKQNLSHASRFPFRSPRRR
jgi:hypothetical protein